MKHTKGEWKFESDGFNTFRISCGGFRLLKFRPFEEAEANAKLMAAAPDLLEALIQIVHMDDELCKCPACKIGKPIIKKAT